MEKVTISDLQKYKTKRIIRMLIAILILIASIGCFFWYKIEVDNVNNNMKSLSSIIQNQDLKQKYVKTYIKASNIPSLIKEASKKGEAYYIVKDNARSYIVYMNEEDFYHLDRYDITETAIRIEGVTVPMKEEIKELAIDTYNKGLTEEEKITSANFERYFAPVTFNMTIGDEILAPIPFFLFILLLSIGLIEFFTNAIYLILFIVSLKKLKNNLSNDLEKEMENAKLYAYKNVSLYLTEHYIINFNGRFKVIRYEDILWMYKYEQRVENVIKTQSIKLFVNDRHTYKLAKAGRTSDKQKEVHNEIWQTIIGKNNKILLGYTDENRKTMQEVKKELKRSKKGQM